MVGLTGSSKNTLSEMSKRRRSAGAAIDPVGSPVDVPEASHAAKMVAATPTVAVVPEAAGTEPLAADAEGAADAARAALASAANATRAALASAAEFNATLARARPLRHAAYWTQVYFGAPVPSRAEFEAFGTLSQDELTRFRNPPGTAAAGGVPALQAAAAAAPPPLAAPPVGMAVISVAGAPVMMRMADPGFPLGAHVVLLEHESLATPELRRYIGSRGARGRRARRAAAARAEC